MEDSSQHSCSKLGQ